MCQWSGRMYLLQAIRGHTGPVVKLPSHAPDISPHGQVKAAFQINDLELEDPECLAYEPPLHAEKGRLWAARADRVLGEGAKRKFNPLRCQWTW